MEEFYTFLNTLTPISKETWSEFKKIVNLSELTPKEHLIKIDEQPKLVFFMVEGYARGYVISHKGKEFNREIFGPAEFLSPLSALIQRDDSKFGIECLTNCKVFCADFEAFMELTAKFPELLMLYLKSLEINFIKLEQRTIELSTMTSTERYIALRNRIPGIDNEISQYHIASHLGITPIQLSRIRKELFSD